ncbi:MAG TPA: hypothetical protein VIY72_13655 [Acidimicrobiales bacterium]
MRRVVAGVDDDGRSCLTEDLDLGPERASKGFERHFVYETEVAPPPARPLGQGSLYPMGLAPGHTRFYLVDQGPDFDVEVPFHHTDTVDIGFILSGSTELVLDDGAHELLAGDCFVILGVDHSWRNGPEGCRICSASIGTPPLS